MSLQFYLGPSGSGKSYKLHKDVTEWAKINPNKNYLFIVPDQFTMQTQIDLVNASECKGIMNVDVLSFGRLAHRVFEELGKDNGIILDDTGKSLIIRRLAGSLKDRMPVIGHNIDRLGYVHEVKSVISEFKQYDIDSEKFEELINYSKDRRLLNSKLRDLKLIYDEFNKYIKKDYITAEETLSLLTDVIEDSEIVKGATVILDGFTGFTPVQYRLIEGLLKLTEKVIVSVTVDIDSEPYSIKGDQELFYLSKETILRLQKLAESIGCVQDEDIILKDVVRFDNCEDLKFLEKGIFRYPVDSYTGKTENIFIAECLNPIDEVNELCIRIKKLTETKGCEYRSMAVVCGDMSTYSDIICEYSKKYNIPFFIDENRSLNFNPFVEMIRSAIEIVNSNFSYDAVLRFLRCGISGFDDDSIDIFDNYILKCGIKGKKNYINAFTRPPYRNAKDGSVSSECIELLNRINMIRAQLVETLEPLFIKAATVGDYIKALYEVIEKTDAENELLKLSERFEAEGEFEKASRYQQVYKLIIDLMEQIYALLGDEKMSISEFGDILDSGIDELKVGSIPGGIDKVLVGDIERTRIGKTGYMFILGVNDGNIPKNNAKGGLISDIDREFLKESGIMLSPSPREQVYTQRLYLYLNMTKPSSGLYISYSRLSLEGKALRESYIISQIRKMFPNVPCRKYVANEDRFEDIANSMSGMESVADLLRELAENNLDKETIGKLAVLIYILSRDEDNKERLNDLIDTAFYTYNEGSISKELSEELYGKSLINSVSRLEKFAACQYAHYLSYGMHLAQREEFSFEKRDLGNVYHSVLEEFAKEVGRRGYTLLNFPESMVDEALDKIVEEQSVNYGEAVLRSSNATSYMLTRIKSIMRRTLITTKDQLQNGAFIPEEFEYSFIDRSIKLRGKIDRIDLYKKDGQIYIKIIDYKSGVRDLELDSLYYGLQMQQPLYMVSAINAIKKKYPECEVSPGAMLYYNIDDPIISAEETIDEKERNEKIENALKTKGLVSNETCVIENMDRGLKGPSYKSTAIPVDTLASGSLSANSKVISEEEYNTIMDYAAKKSVEMSNSILDGNIAVNPTYVNTSLCNYCEFSQICPYDEKIKGYSMKQLPHMEKGDALEAMREANGR